MASSSSIVFSSFFFFSFLVVTCLTTAPAPAPAAEGPIDLMGILEKGSQFKSFMHLLNSTQVGYQVSIQLNSSNQGLTVFAPTDNGFNNLKSGTLNNLTDQQQIQLMLYHITPKYYSFSDLLSVSNPVRTLANGQDGQFFGLNFTGQGNQVNVSTGVIETQLNNALKLGFPLAVYTIEKVLLPEAFFGSSDSKPKAPTESPVVPEAPEAPEGETPSPEVEPPAAEEHKSGAGSRGTQGLGLVFGLAWLWFGVLLP